MAAIRTFISKHAVWLYFVITFAISWGGVLAIVGPSNMPGTQEEFNALMPMAILAMLLGPSVAGILMTGLVSGRAGLRALGVRLLRGRVGLRWYAVALLTAPLLFVVILGALSLFSRTFLPGLFASDDKVGTLLFGIATGLGAGLFEELGWTGFAIPTLRQRHGVLATGAIVGLVWAVWHLLVTYWASGSFSGSLTLVSYMLDPFLFLVAFRVLMVFVYDRTGSLLVAMLMHMSLTASARIFSPQGMAGGPLLTFDALWAAVVWVIVIGVVAAKRAPRGSYKGDGAQ